MVILIIIGIILFGYCVAGGQFIDRLFGLIIGSIIGIVILIFILGKIIGIF